jgi:hypothetical protein
MSTPFLIPPSDRNSFVAVYVGMTIGLWVIFGTLFSVPPLSLIANVAVRVAVHSFLTGLGVGVGQWWALRLYLPHRDLSNQGLSSWSVSNWNLPKWGWIGATAIGASLAALTQNLWYTALFQTLEQPNSGSFLDFFVSSPLGILIPLQGVTILAFCVWLAGAQWLVLRQLVQAAAWWILTPLLGMSLTWLILLIALIVYAVIGGQLLSDRVLFPGMLATVQALMLCRFRIKKIAQVNEINPIQPSEEMHQERIFPFVGLSTIALFSVVVLSISIQGFLSWFGM